MRSIDAGLSFEATTAVRKDIEISRYLKFKTILQPSQPLRLRSFQFSLSRWSPSTLSPAARSAHTMYELPVAQTILSLTGLLDCLPVVIYCSNEITAGNRNLSHRIWRPLPAYERRIIKGPKNTTHQRRIQGRGEVYSVRFYSLTGVCLGMRLTITTENFFNRSSRRTRRTRFPARRSIRRVGCIPVGTCLKKRSTTATPPYVLYIS